MDPISYGVAAKQKQRIEQVIANPDSTSGIVTTPSVIAAGETITIPTGRTAVLPNTTVNGTLDVQGEVFIPSGSSYTATEVDVTVIKQNGNTVVDTMQNQLVGGVKTFSSFPITPNSAPTADYQVANKIYVDSKGVTGVRQTVQYASIDSTTGQPNFLSVGTIDHYDTHDVFSDGSTVATYQLNGNANDLGGINNATATNTTYSNGKFGQGAVFSGNSRVVKALTYRSMSLWVKFTSLPNAVQTILDNRDDNGDNLYGLQTAANNTLTTTSEAMYINGVLTASGAYTIPLNEWIHVVLIPSANSTNMVLGSRFSLDQTFLNNAMVDQVRLFNRALTSDEVAILRTEKKAVAGLSVGVLATTKNIKISAAGGDTDLIGKITADTTITGLSASATNYLYADIASDGSVTFGFTTLVPIYKQGGTPSVTSGQFTFNIGEMKGYLGNGTTASQVYRVFIGECVTGTSAVTSVVNYTLNGYYDSGWTNTLPASAVQTVKSHNLGVVPNDVRFKIKCLTSEANYSVGDIIDNVITTNGSSIWSSTHLYKTAKTVGVTSYVSANPWAVVNKTAGTLVPLTNANWAYSFTAQRGW